MAINSRVLFPDAPYPESMLLQEALDRYELAFLDVMNDTHEIAIELPGIGTMIVTTSEWAAVYLIPPATKMTKELKQWLSTSKN